MRSLSNGVLRMTADGATVVVRDHHELTCLSPGDLASRWRVEIVGARDHVVTGASVWVLAEARLVRIALASGAVEAAQEVPAGGEALVAGAAGVIACAGERAWLATTRGDETVVTPVPACELALPVDAIRLISVDGGVAELRRSGAAVWSGRLGERDERAIAGAVVLEGRAAAICLARRDGDSVRLVVVDVRDGAILHALAAEGVDQIGFAPRRGWALLRRGEHGLAAIDLRIGRVVSSRDHDERISDLATDAGFERVVLRLGEPPRLVVASGEALTAATTAATAPPAIAVTRVAAPSPVAPVVSSDPVAEPAPPRIDGPLRGLAEPVSATEASSDEAAVDLQTRLYWIGALVDQAIAGGWDCGRIAAPSSTAMPFEDEVAATLRGVRGRATGQVERAARHLAHYQQVRADVVARRGDRVTPLDRLARELGLSPLAVDVLTAAAAPLLWGELARLYGIVANDPARPLCDELLICQLLGGLATRGAIARELDPDQPLRRAGLLVLDDRLPRPFGAIRVEPLVLALLRGVPPGACAGDVIGLAASRTPDQLRLGPDVLPRLLPALAEPGATPARIALCGRLGIGRRTLAAALAATCGRLVGRIDASPEDDDHLGRAERLRDRLGRCRILGWIPCVEGLDDVAVAEHPARRSIIAVLAAHPGPLLLRLSGDAVVPLEPGYRRVELGSLTEGARGDAWTDSLQRHGLPVDDAAILGARFRVGPGVAERAATTAAAGLAAEDLEPTPEATLRSVDASVRQHLEDRLGTTATRVHRLASWTDLVLPDDILDSLLELVSRVRRRRQVFETWGYDRRIATARGVTALFQGGPGTGKTLAAGVIARELGIDLYRVDVAQVVSKWVGETEKNLAAVFDAAEDGQAMLLFDEADSLFARRTEVKSSSDRYANLEVNYLLQRLDSFEGIAILTTNLASSIDPAFKRRVGMRLSFPFPDEEMREQMWRAHVPDEVPRAGELEFGELSRRYQLSGGYIRNAALRAAFLAAEEGVSLAQQHLERAIRLEFREVGKLSESGALE